MRKSSGLLKTLYDKSQKALVFFLVPTLLFFLSFPSALSAVEFFSKPQELSPLNEEYINAKLSIELFFNDDPVAISISQIGAMAKKELTTFKNFLVYCSSFIDLFLKGSHVLYQCRIAQRHFNFQYNNNRELDWLIENMLMGISYVHDEFGGSRFKEDFIIRKRKIENEWIRAITRRYLELEGKPKDNPPKT